MPEVDEKQLGRVAQLGIFLTANLAAVVEEDFF
jgi:hypothetical protein